MYICLMTYSFFNKPLIFSMFFDFFNSYFFFNFNVLNFFKSFLSHFFFNEQFENNLDKYTPINI